MTCDEMAELLPDLWQAGLAPDMEQAVKLHLVHCMNCQREVSFWETLGSLPEQRPSPGLRASVASLIAAYREGVREPAALASVQRERRRSWFTQWLGMPALQAGLAVVCLVVGFIAGQRLTPKQAHDSELQALRTELSQTHQLVALSLLEQQTASARLDGINRAMQINTPTPEITAALLHALRADPSVDVRLAAVDALRRYTAHPDIRSSLLDAFAGKQSPLVQISLIDLFVEKHDRDALVELQKRSGAVEPVVTKRLQWGLKQWS